MLKLVCATLILAFANTCWSATFFEIDSSSDGTGYLELETVEKVDGGYVSFITKFDTSDKVMTYITEYVALCRQGTDGMYYSKQVAKASINNVTKRTVEDKQVVVKRHNPQSNFSKTINYACQLAYKKQGS